MVSDVIISSGIEGFMTLLGFILLFIAIARICEGSKSRRYRNLLVDMYVVGVTKQIASKDGIDLDKELLAFAKIEKKARISEQGLASVIEAELKEKVAKVAEEPKK